ncbi:potassium channel family protein [Desulfosediminicola flagellatus]|uniref:potassium channel family protein n=1 Tax=Desulfosediminicola flagellatus TaxID=2569541 RepID=UPI0010AC6B0D|nr:potassium channel family protein [Desulfosediminicola flagellatus]
MFKFLDKFNSREYGFRNLLCFLLIYIFGSPFISSYPSLSFVAHTLLSLTLCFSVLAVQKQQNYRSFAMAALLPVLILYWLDIYNLIPFSRLGSYSLIALYYCLLVISFAIQISRSKHITFNLLCATLCLYLIIGLFWGTLYALLYEINPEAYSGAMLENTKGRQLIVFNYFSMVTLTTLGYGDITPQTPGAAALCQFEAIIGQFFTAVIVAWYVGNFVARQDRPKKD